MPRTRDRSVVEVVAGRYGAVDSAGNYTSPTDVSTPIVKLDVMTDEVTPFFRRKVKEGKVIFNPLEMIRTSFTWFPVNKYWATYSNGSGLHGGEGQNWSLVTQPVDPRLPGGLLQKQHVIDAVQQCENVAVTEAYAEVGKATAETLVSLGELGETLAFLISPLRGVKRLTDRFNRYRDILQRDLDNYERNLKRWSSLPEHVRAKRAKPTLPKRQLRLGKFEASDISSLWLAYRYGLMPLIYDIQDHWNAFQNLANKPPPRQTARGKFKKVYTVDDPPTVEGNPTEGSKWVTTRTTDYTVTSRAGVLYVPRIEGVAEKFGLEMHRIPSALWEWIPLSFVADWLLNMGDFIDAMSAHLRAKEILGAWVTTTVEYSHSAVFEFTPTYGGQSGRGQYVQFCTRKRRRMVTLADISLQVRLEMNGKRVADAFALAHQLLLATLRKK